MVDAHVLGACGAIYGGSSPLPGTRRDINDMKKRIYKKWIYFLILLFVAGFLFLSKLDTTIPTVKLKFVSRDPLKEQQLEYSYSYQGDDLMRGNKFGGYGYSEIKTAITGQIVEIPTKRIISYWPFSKFTYLLINGDQIETSQGYCSWAASIWADKHKSLLDQDNKIKENVGRHLYLINTSSEFIFDNVKDKVIEVKCL